MQARVAQPVAAGGSIKLRRSEGRMIRVKSLVHAERDIDDKLAKAIWALCVVSDAVGTSPEGSSRLCSSRRDRR